MKHNKDGLEGKKDVSQSAFKKDAWVLVPVAFWANYIGLCVKYDGSKDQGKLDILALTIGVFETEGETWCAGFPHQSGIPPVILNKVNKPRTYFSSPQNCTLFRD